MTQILAIDIGGSQMRVAPVSVFINNQKNVNFEVGASVQVKLPPAMTPDGILGTLEELCVPIFQKMPLHSFDKIGMTIPGLADSRTWIYAPFSGIQNFPIVSALEQRWNRTVIIENDVNACAWAEAVFGKCKNVDDFIWMTISNGIGGGVVLNGQIYRGASGFSGEFGHLCVVPDGELCGCGKRGCLEAECAGPGISRYYARISENHETISAKEIAQRAQAGEPAAIATFERTGQVLGLALANAANILNPAKIILGGGVSQAWALFEPAMSEMFEKNLFRRANDGLKIERTALGYDAALLGAVAITMQR